MPPVELATGSSNIHTFLDLESKHRQAFQWGMLQPTKHFQSVKNVAHVLPIEFLLKENVEYLKRISFVCI